MTRKAMRRFVRGMPFLVGWCGAYLVLSMLEMIDAALELVATFLAHFLAGAALVTAMLYGLCGCGVLLLGAIGFLAPSGPRLAVVMCRAVAFFGVALGFAFAGTGVEMLPGWLDIPARPKRRLILCVMKPPKSSSMEPPPGTGTHRPCGNKLFLE